MALFEHIKRTKRNKKQKKIQDEVFESVLDASTTSTHEIHRTLLDSSVIEEELLSVRERMLKLEHQLKMERAAVSALRDELRFANDEKIASENYIATEKARLNDIIAKLRSEITPQSSLKHLLHKLRPVWHPSPNTSLSEPQIRKLQNECRHWLEFRVLTTF